MLHVHLQFDLTPDQIRYLKTLLDGTICLTVGETPQPARFTILVHGFPAGRTCWPARTYTP